MTIIIIDLMTFDTIRITLAGSDVHRGFNRVRLLWTCAGVTVRPAVMQCGAAPPSAVAGLTSQTPGAALAPCPLP